MAKLKSQKPASYYIEGLVMTLGAEKERRSGHQGSTGGGSLDLSGLSTGASASDAGFTILLLILVIAGAVILAYFVVIAFVNLITFGEVHKASVYSRKIRRYSIEDEEGCSLARGLTKTNIYFSVVLSVFTAEEAIRYVFHTGPATAEIWVFRLACLFIFIVILGVFLARLSRWMRFKSTTAFLKASDEIRDVERSALYAHRRR
ncbi:MAG: hypothetical protein WED04_11605 [Promethearchaeati archaeon SRVP18_Atabeyarchaeia-1]